jgi:hypothetical protein
LKTISINIVWVDCAARLAARHSETRKIFCVGIAIVGKPVCEAPPNTLARRRRFRHIAGMKSLTEQLWFEIPGRRGFVNITDTVAGLVRTSGVQEGLCLVNARGMRF